MSFSVDVKKFADQTNTDMGMAKRAIIFNVFGSVVRKNPVDTGRSKGNWFVTQNTPSRETTEREDDTPLGSINATSEAILNTVTNEFTVDILTNNLPYIVPLERGHSKQAPAGMVRTTLREFERIAKKEGWK